MRDTPGVASVFLFPSLVFSLLRVGENFKSSFKVDDKIGVFILKYKYFKMYCARFQILLLRHDSVV